MGKYPEQQEQDGQPDQDASKWSIYEILADEDKVLELSTAEWLASEPDEEGQTIGHYEYVVMQAEAIKEDGIRYSEDALNLAFYLTAAELLVAYHEAAEQRVYDQSGRYQL